MSNQNRRRRNRRPKQRATAIADSNGTGRQYDINESRKGGLSVSRVRNSVKQDMSRRIRENRKENHVHPDASHPESACLSNAVCKYMCTLADPTLDMLHAGPIPVALPPPGPVSMQRFKVRGQANTGTSALGFISIAAAWCGPYSDRNMVSFTTASYPSNMVDYTVGVPDVNELPWANTPYAANGSSIAKLAYRLTGCQIRCRNVTNILAKGGQLTVLEAQNHNEGYFHGLTYAQIASNPRARTFNLSTTEDGWISLNWHPAAENTASDLTTRNALSGLEFSARNLAVNAPTGLSLGSELLIAFEATGVANVQGIEFEVYGIYELKGTDVKGKTDFPRDSEGWGYASTAISEIKSRSGEEERASGNPIARMGKLVRYYVKEAADAAEQVIPLALNVYKMFGGG